MEVVVDCKPRDGNKKGAVKNMRREGMIPCVIYSKGKVGENAVVSKEQIDTVLRELEFGYLPTTVFVLKDSSGKKRKAIVKDIQYKVTSYDVLHIDFLELQDDHQIDIKVPLECLNAAECSGVKAGGFLRQVKSHIPVRCLPKNIPSHFEVDVKDVDIRQVRRVSDIQIPTHVLPLVKLQDVVATVIK